MHIQKDINMRIKYSVLRLKKCKYETSCVGYDTQVTVKACGPLVVIPFELDIDEKKYFKRSFFVH